MNVYMSYRSNIPSASMVQPSNTIVTTASLPNRLQPISFRQSRDTSVNCRRSVIQKTPSSTNDNHTTDRDQSVPCAIRV
jgi:hypothetical protein